MKKWLLPLICFTTSLFADCDGCFSSCECCSIEHSGYLHLKHREPGGIGYPRGYTTLGLFYTWSNCGPTYTFIDLRGHIDNDGKWASNLGIGTRTIADDDDVITGFNLYWDWRNARRGSYHKIGVGFEVLWPYWDFHFNGYIPIGKERHSTSKGFDHFKGHSAYMFKKYILNMGGFDTSIGYWLFKCGCVDMHASLGGYYFRGNFDSQFGGGIAKAKLRFWDLIELEGQVSYDNKFKWIGQGELGIYIPFGHTLPRYPRKTGCCADIIALEQRLLEQPDRFEISVLASEKRTSKARHPYFCKPLTFYFVDNTSSSDGTIESPFPTFAQAQAASSIGDAIYVFPGNGAGYNETITLKTNQLLGGSGAPFEVESRFGFLEIPQLTASKPAMIGSGNKVVLANNNRITGMSLTSNDSNAIVGTNIQNLTVKDNQLNAAINGVVINSSFSGIANISHNSISSSNGSNGILFNTFRGQANISDNSISDFSIGIFFNNITGQANLLHNSITAGFFGILFTNSFSGQANFSSNSILSNFSIAFASPTSGQINFSNNSLTSITNGILFTDIFRGQANFSSNSITSIVSEGILFNNTFTGQANFSNNSISSSDSTGISFGDIFTGQATFLHNSIVAGANGINFNNNFSGSALFSHNTIVAGDSGIDFDELFTGTLIGEYNHITSEDSGLSIILAGASMLLRNNTFIQLDGDDPTVEIESREINDAIIHNNLFQFLNGFPPVFFWRNANGTSHVQFAENTSISGNSPDTFFTVLGGILELESPNSALSGLQAINEGVIDTNGVTFVPFE